MPKKNIYNRYIELLIIFVIIPVSYVLPYPVGLKLLIGGIGLLYIVYVLFKTQCSTVKHVKTIDWNVFWRETAIKLMVIAIVTTVFVFYTDKLALFKVVTQYPLKWVMFICIYSLFSVYPQELIYRTFFFRRYQTLFKTKYALIFSNALLFALAHLFFESVLVLVLTFIGGLLFAVTYLKTKSIVLVCIEHAIYGSWLFTVGMGQMLGFPV